MKNLFYSTMLVCIVLSSCNLFTSSSPNGTYIVYKSEAESIEYPKYKEQLKKRYGEGQYVLNFADKYVKLSDPGTNDMLVLAKESSNERETIYTLRSIEGADSVAVTTELKLTKTDTILRVSAILKSTVRHFGGLPTTDVSVKCYLSRTR